MKGESWGSQLPASWLWPCPGFTCSWAVASAGGGAVELGWVSLHLFPHPRDASSGDWDTESCQTLETQAAHTRCQCQRPSTFAVLAQPPKDLVSGKVPGLGRKGAPGLPAAISDSGSRKLVIPHVCLSRSTSGIAHGSLSP